MISAENNIQFLRTVLNKKLEDNNYEIDEDVIKLSQLLDKFIVQYQYENIDDIDEDVIDNCIN